MKREYITCDRCHRTIKRGFPSIGKGRISVQYATALPMNLEKTMAKVREIKEELNKDFCVEVLFDSIIKYKNYDLCYSCSKELEAFIEGVNTNA